MPVHLDADAEGIYADAFHFREQELLAAAGFVETEPTRLRIPASRAPLDAMLDVEYAVDLLLGAGQEVTIGSAVTDALDQRPTNPPADPSLFTTATAAVGHLEGEWKVQAFRHPVLAPSMSWAADGSRTRAASREATGAAEYVELTGPDGAHFMLAQPMDTRQVTITPATPTSLPPGMRPPAVYGGKPTYAAAEPEAIAAELDLMLPAYKSAALLAMLAVLSDLVRDLNGISTTWGAVEAAFEREPRPDRTERLAARQHRDRTAWTVMESSTMVLRAVLGHSQHLLGTGQLSPDSGQAEAIKDLTDAARTLNDRSLRQWNRKRTSGTLEAQVKAGERMNWAWPLAESLRTQLPQIIALSDTAAATRPAVSTRAQAARSGLRRGPAGTASALVEGWKAAIRSANGRRR